MSTPNPSPSSSPSPSPSSAAPAATGERADLVDALRTHRDLFLTTVAGLTDEQAALTPTASELSLGGLVKHVATTEAEWQRFVREGAADEPEVDWASVDPQDPPDWLRAYQDQFRMLPGETLTDLVAAYRRVSDATLAMAGTVDLDGAHALPRAPWFEAGATWTARRVLAHVLAETAQHAGHADIIRETIDGRRSMG